LWRLVLLFHLCSLVVGSVLIGLWHSLCWSDGCLGNNFDPVPVARILRRSNLVGPGRSHTDSDRPVLGHYDRLVVDFVDLVVGFADLVVGLADLVVGLADFVVGLADLVVGLGGLVVGLDDLVVGLDDLAAGPDDLVVGLDDLDVGLDDLVAGLDDLVVGPDNLGFLLGADIVVLPVECFGRCSVLAAV
jgi:hypothetical protein